MKHFFILAIVLFFAGGIISVNAQDLIILRNGNIIEAKVMEISPTEIRYKRLNNLNGPMIVIPADSVLSIRYENGITEVITEAVTGGIGSTSGSTSSGAVGGASVQQTGLTAPLLMILNALPPVPVAGNNLKFEFTSDTWTAKVNGENFSTGTIEFETTGGGAILTLKQTHIWPGAVGRTAGRIANVIPGGSAVGGVLNTAGSVAGLAGAVEAPGTEMVLEYKAGPPASLSLVSTRSTTDESITEASAGSDPQQEPREFTNDNRLKTLGISIGTSFFNWEYILADPALIFTLHGTFSPVQNLIFQLGFDLGFVSVYEDVESYFSFYPFARIGFFIPFREKGGWYAGAGCGYMAGEYGFSYGKAPVSVFALDLITGFNIANIIDISYSLRTDFGSANSKLSAGYVYRFK